MPPTAISKTISQLKSNGHYFQTTPGMIRLSELCLGIICFGCILGGSSRYYDPYLGTIDTGFAGGTLETVYLLNCYTFLLCTFLIIIGTLTAPTLTSTSPIRSTVTSTSTNRLSFCFIYHFTAFVITLVNSLALMIIVSNRNRNQQTKEPGYATKIVASVFGLLLSLCYLLSTMFTFRTSSILAAETDTNVNYLTSRCGASVVTSGLGISTDSKFRRSSRTRTSSAFLPAWVRQYIASANTMETVNPAPPTHVKEDKRTSNVYDEISIPVPESTSSTNVPTKRRSHTP